MRRAAYILVGGKSSRFGSDKALFMIDGRPLVLRLAETLKQIAVPVTLVGSPGAYEHLGLRVIPDSFADIGPLAGILAAIEDTSEPWNLVVACDMPFLTAEFARFLLSCAAATEHDVILPVSPAGVDEPLCAVYARGVAPTIRREIEKGTRKITIALRELRVRRVMPSEYEAYDPAGRVFTNVNTLDEWKGSETAG